MGSISSNINLMLVFFILAPTFPFLNIIDDLRDIICNVVIYANKTTLHSVIRDLIFSNNQSGILNSHVIQETLQNGKKWPLDFSAGKTKNASFDQSNNSLTIDKKTEKSILKKKHPLRC